MRYMSDLTNEQWKLIKQHFKSKKGTHLKKHSKRKLVNAVLYIVKTGCQWRQLPHDFPNYKTVSSFYQRAIKSGLWEKILSGMVIKVRIDAGRTVEPSYALIDSQSTKTTFAAENRGIDGGKKNKGS